MLHRSVMVPHVGTEPSKQDRVMDPSYLSGSLQVREAVLPMTVNGQRSSASQ